MVRYSLILFLIFVLGSCNDSLLLLDREEFIETSLKLGGYYYSPFKTHSGDRFITYFLYKNGVLLYGGSPLVNEIHVRENEYKDGTYGDYTKGNKTDWGVFQIKEDSIVIERWGATSGYSLKTAMYYGEILNDTTFLMKKYKSNYGGGIQSIQDTFYFRSFSPKPDSTNNYIK